MNTKEFPMFLLEHAIMLIHFAPFIDSLQIVRNNFYTCFGILAFVFVAKILCLFELLYHYSPINTSKGIFVSSMSKTKLNGPFLIKAWIKAYPLMALSIGMLGFVLMNSFLIYMVERGD